MRALAIGCALAMSAAAVAGPKPKEEAKRRIDRAAALHKEGKFDDALAELEAAYKLDPEIDLLFSIGQVYSKLGRCDEARGKFEEFAAKKKSKEASSIVAQAIAACIPKAPPVPPPAAVEATPPSVEPTSPVTPAPTFASATSASPPQPPPPTVDSRAWYRDALGDGLVLAGVAAAVVGTIEYHSATSALNAAESAGSLASYDQLVSEAHDKRTISVVLFAGGAVLVAGGIVRFALHDRSHERATLAVVPAQGGGLVTIGGGF